MKLSGLEWISDTGRFFTLLVTRGCKASLEDVVVRAAHLKEDPTAAAISIIQNLAENPEAVQGALGDYNSLTLPTDPHYQSVQVNLKQQDISGIETVFSDIAKDLNVRLYDAGRLHKPDKNGYYFTDFAGWEQWQKIPSHWKRVV